MTTEAMRVAITKVYDNPRWRDRVSRMPSYQVMAIYFDFKKRGLLDKPERLPGISDVSVVDWARTKSPEDINTGFTDEEKSYGWDAVQLTMDEFL